MTEPEDGDRDALLRPGRRAPDGGHDGRANGSRPRRGAITHGGMAARGITADEASTVLVEQSQQDNTKGVGTVREREE